MVMIRYKISIEKGSFSNDLTSWDGYQEDRESESIKEAIEYHPPEAQLQRSFYSEVDQQYQLSYLLSALNIMLSRNGVVVVAMVTVVFVAKLVLVVMVVVTLTVVLVVIVGNV